MHYRKQKDPNLCHQCQLAPIALMLVDKYQELGVCRPCADAIRNIKKEIREDHEQRRLLINKH